MRRTVAILFALAALEATATDLFLAKNIIVTANWFSGEKTFTFTDADWINWYSTKSWTIIPMQNDFAISSEFYAQSTHEYQFYGSKVAGLYAYPNGSEETITMEGDSFYPAGYHAKAVMTDPVRCSFSNTTGIRMTLGGHTIEANTITPALWKSTFTAEGREDAHYTFTNLDTGDHFVVDSGAELEFLIGRFKISASVPSKDFPTLLVNDIKGDGTSIVYGKYNTPVFQFPVFFSPTDIKIYTEWVFDQDSYGTPKAYINNSVVCEGHDTGHIIDYAISDGAYEYDANTREYKITFTMKITPGIGKYGGSCTFRCWYGAATYDAAAETRRASVEGTHATVPTFTFCLNKRTGSVTIRAN